MQVLILKYLLDPTGNHLIVTHCFGKSKENLVPSVNCIVNARFSATVSSRSSPHISPTALSRTIVTSPALVRARTLPTLTYRVEKQVGSTSEGTGKADTPIFDFGR